MHFAQTKAHPNHLFVEFLEKRQTFTHKKYFGPGYRICEENPPKRHFSPYFPLSNYLCAFCVHIKSLGEYFQQ